MRKFGGKFAIVLIVAVGATLLPSTATGGTYVEAREQKSVCAFSTDFRSGVCGVLSKSDGINAAEFDSASVFAYRTRMKCRRRGNVRFCTLAVSMWANFNAEGDVTIDPVLGTATIKSRIRKLQGKGRCNVDLTFDRTDLVDNGIPAIVKPYENMPQVFPEISEKGIVVDARDEGTANEMVRYDGKACGWTDMKRGTGIISQRRTNRAKIDARP